MFSPKKKKNHFHQNNDFLLSDKNTFWLHEKLLPLIFGEKEGGGGAQRIPPSSSMLKLYSAVNLLLFYLFMKGQQCVKIRTLSSYRLLYSQEKNITFSRQKSVFLLVKRRTLSCQLSNALCFMFKIMLKHFLDFDLWKCLNVKTFTCFDLWKVRALMLKLLLVLTYES